MELSQDIRQAAERARARPPAGGDPSLAVLRDARAGEPCPVAAPDGKAAFWIVPYVRGDLACGFAQVDANGAVSRIAVFGTGDPASWIEASYFADAPGISLAEIRARHPGEPLSEPVFSYDASPSRWGWRIDGPGWTAFIGPGGWYERPAGNPRNPELEG